VEKELSIIWKRTMKPTSKQLFLAEKARAHLTIFEMLLKISVPEISKSSNKIDSYVVIIAPSLSNRLIATYLSFSRREETQSSTITGW
jgi:hypothetical protein